MHVYVRLSALRARQHASKFDSRWMMCAALLLAMVTSASTSAATAVQARANDPVAIGETNTPPAESVTATRTEASNSPATNVDPRLIASNRLQDPIVLAAGQDSTSDNGSALAASAQQNALEYESQPLGEPRKVLGSGSVEDSTTLNATSEADQLGSNSKRSGLNALRGEVGHIVQVVGALIVVVALILLTRFVLMRSAGVLGGAGRPSGVLEILARFPIARGQSLVIIKMARRIVLVHQTNTGMTTLTEVTDPDEVASLLTRIEAGASGRDQHRFKNILEQFQSEHNRIDKRDPSHMASEQDSEIIDLTRRQSGGMRNWFGGAR